MSPSVRAGGRRSRPALRIVLDFALPTVLYYVLRAFGTSIYLALLGGALISAATMAVSLARTRRVDGMAAYMATMMLGGVAVALVTGSTRFLLAREALLTGVTGMWFLVSVRGAQPLAYLFSRPLLEGRLRWPGSWDALWERSPGFRRLWRVSSVLYGIGTLLDAALRVVMAYTLAPDVVPALGSALYGATSFVLIVVTNIYYVRSGVFDHGSAIYRGSDPSGTMRLPVTSAATISSTTGRAPEIHGESGSSAISASRASSVIS